MSKAAVLFVLPLLLFAACTKPVAVEIKDVCSKPNGTIVVLHGFISLPREMEITRYTRGGERAGTTYRLHMTTNADSSGHKVAAIFSGTSTAEQNRVKNFPPNYAWSDLIAYTDDGQSFGAGKLLKVTGETDADEKDGCSVNIQKIEQQ